MRFKPYWQDKIKKMRRNNEEQRLQEWFALWLNSKNILFNASMAGVNLGIATAKARKQMGAKAGFPDIFIYEPRGGFNGMAIELKAKGGTMTNEQTDWSNRLTDKKYYSLIMSGKLKFYEAQKYLEKVTTEYLSLK